MTTPIDPGDTAALHDIFTDHCAYEGADMYPALQAVARSVCPDDCVVVRRDDLRGVVEAIRHCRNVLAVGNWPDLDQETIDTVFRWKDIIGDEG